jgi:hypothetical protein
MMRVPSRREYRTQRAGSCEAAPRRADRSNAQPGGPCHPTGPGGALVNPATRSSRPDSSVTRRWSRSAVTAARSCASRAAERSRRACARPGGGIPRLAAGRWPERLQQQQRPSLRHQPPAIGRHSDPGTARGSLHLESVFGSARTGPSASPILPGQRHCLRTRRGAAAIQPKARG